jgi:hypothetical protein
VDVVMPNEIEARALLKDGHDLPADELGGALARGLGVPIVVVTLGERGAWSMRMARVAGIQLSRLSLWTPPALVTRSRRVSPLTSWRAMPSRLPRLLPRGPSAILVVTSPCHAGIDRSSGPWCWLLVTRSGLEVGGVYRHVFLAGTG